MTDEATRSTNSGRSAPESDGTPLFVDADGVMLHVRREAAARAPAHADRADGIPSLVYLHSLGTDLRIWDGVVARLPEHEHLRIDLRGHGLSDVPAGDYTIARMTDDVIAVLEQVGLQRTVVVGVSVGGQIALRAALARPASVVGVVALDTAARIGDRATWDARIAAVRAGGIEAIADAVVERWFAASIADRAPLARRGYRNLLLRAPVAGYLATCAALRDEDLTPHLAALRQPVLVMCGSDDTATPPALVQDLAAALPRARYLELDDTGHLPCIDRPDVTARHIGAFARATGPG